MMSLGSLIKGFTRPRRRPYGTEGGLRTRRRRFAFCNPRLWSIRNFSLASLPRGPAEWKWQPLQSCRNHQLKGAQGAIAGVQRMPTRGRARTARYRVSALPKVKMEQIGLSSMQWRRQRTRGSWAIWEGSISTSTWMSFTRERVAARVWLMYRSMKSSLLRQRALLLPLICKLSQDLAGVCSHHRITSTKVAWLSRLSVKRTALTLRKVKRLRIFWKRYESRCRSRECLIRILWAISFSVCLQSQVLQIRSRLSLLISYRLNLWRDSKCLLLRPLSLLNIS